MRINDDLAVVNENVRNYVSRETRSEPVAMEKNEPGWKAWPGVKFKPPRKIGRVDFRTEENCLASESQKRLNLAEQRCVQPDGPHRHQISQACVMTISCN